jgi:hypothetical protein
VRFGYPVDSRRIQLLSIMRGKSGHRWVLEGIRPERRRALYDPGVVPNRQFDKGRAFSKCTQVGLVGAFAKIPAMARNTPESFIERYIGSDMLSITWIASRYFS